MEEKGHYKVIVTVELDMHYRYGPGVALITGVDQIRLGLPDDAYVTKAEAVWVKED